MTQKEEFINEYGVTGAYYLINRLSNAQTDDDLRHAGYKLANDILKLSKELKEEIKC